MIESKQEYFECTCSSPEHRLVFKLEDYLEYLEMPEMHTEVYLHDYRNIFKRIWTAIKYVFGYKCRYGHFDCFILQAKDTIRLHDLLSRYIDKHDRWVEKLKEGAKE